MMIVDFVLVFKLIRLEIMLPPYFCSISLHHMVHWKWIIENFGCLFTTWGFHGEVCIKFDATTIMFVLICTLTSFIIIRQLEILAFSYQSNQVT
jgi:hypothetical protein